MAEGSSPTGLVARVLSAGLVVLLVLPVVALALTTGLSDLSAATERGLWEALGLSVATTGASVAVLLVCGTPLAWWLGRTEGRFARVIEAIVRLPVVTPPAVAGVALLAAFGRRGLFGGALEGIGVGLPFTTAAVVVAQLFVAAPFFVLPLADAFRGIDEEMLWTARSLGATPTKVFFRICVPIAMPALLGGLAIAWARALGEFGATLVFAGNLPGTTQTLPIAIYAAMEGDLGAARAMALLLLLFSAALFLGLRSRAAERLLGARS